MYDNSLQTSEISEKLLRFLKPGQTMMIMRKQVIRGRSCFLIWVSGYWKSVDTVSAALEVLHK